SMSPSTSRGFNPEARIFCSSGGRERAVDREAVRALLEDVQAGRIDVDAAVRKLRGLPYEDLRFAKVDHHRALRGGAPEAVFCPGKTPAQVVAIVRRLAEHHANVLATRADAAVPSALAEANVIVAVAGMEGALPSVIGGLLDRPVIAVPTSIGYGASFGGIAALLAMLNSCAPGVSVVNIDNGYGAAHQASQINHLIAKVR